MKTMDNMEIIGTMDNYKISAKFFADFINNFFSFIEAIRYNLKNNIVKIFIYEDIEADIPFFLEKHGIR